MWRFPCYQGLHERNICLKLVSSFILSSQITSWPARVSRPSWQTSNHIPTWCGFTQRELTIQEPHCLGRGKHSPGSTQRRAGGPRYDKAICGEEMGAKERLNGLCTVESCRKEEMKMMRSGLILEICSPPGAMVMYQPGYCQGRCPCPWSYSSQFLCWCPWLLCHGYQVPCWFQWSHPPPGAMLLLGPCRFVWP